MSSLDSSRVKQKCRLSLNLSREPTSGRPETLYVKSQKRRAGDPFRPLSHELNEITLTSELYLAPELMYAEMNLPSLVKSATRDLPDYLVKDCFSNILITGITLLFFPIHVCNCLIMLCY